MWLNNTSYGKSNEQRRECRSTISVLRTSLFMATLPAWIWTWGRKNVPTPASGRGPISETWTSPRRPGRLAPGERREYHRTTPDMPQEVTMDDHLSWDELYPFMEEVKALARGLLRHEHHASLQTTALVLSALRRQRHADQDWQTVTWANRQYFFGALYRAMDTGAPRSRPGAGPPPRDPGPPRGPPGRRSAARHGPGAGAGGGAPRRAGRAQAAAAPVGRSHCSIGSTAG